MIWRPFYARVKGNHRRVYSRILVKVCCCHGNGAGYKKALKNVFCLFTKIQVLEFQEIWPKSCQEITKNAYDKILLEQC